MYTSPFSLGTSRWIFAEPPTDDVNRYAEFLLEVSVRESHTTELILSADADAAVYRKGDAFPLFFHTMPDTEKRKTHETVVLSELLPVGTHTLTVTVFCPNVDFSTYRKNRPAVRFLVLEDGAPVLGSSRETKCRMHPHYRSGAVDKISGQLGFSFVYDATAEETPWHDAFEVDGMPEDTVPRPIPRLDTSVTLSPVCISSGAWRDAEGETEDRIAIRMQRAVLGKGHGEYAIYDFSREETGYLAFTSNAAEETELFLGYGEFLDGDRCRTAIGPRNFAFRVKIPAGQFTFFAPFLRLGLR
ncbi:MAG: hypothetical protein J6B77_02120, partial [Clostridia bacterium]|nr:hypothetical protein [Clostridia bacterium]